MLSPVVSTVDAERTSTGTRTPARQRLTDLVFVLLGSVGALAIVWLVFAGVTGATVIVFKTGSMAPTLPQGAASVSMPTLAPDLRVGDVITVAIDDSSLPVTHRIVSINETGDPTTREVALKGDDNNTADLFPYVVSEVPKVIIGGPGWGTALDTLRAPFVIGGLTLGVAGLVLWAFWPQEPDRSAPERSGAATTTE
ncbi:signal peptidase I [Mycetocola sp. 2940]|uniref:signal peptidase I n=1 Tax=Mycetocola sp. 2940 TaxID=3156452 RepID=UPI00339448E7